MTAFIQALNNYIPKSHQLMGLIVVLIGSLFCLWLNTSLDIWSNGETDAGPSANSRSANDKLGTKGILSEKTWK